MSLRIEIQCYHQHRCECKPIAETKVTKEEIAYNLVRCNPALAKYFGRKSVIAETVVERNQMRRQHQDKTPYKSIVDEKKLNILLPDRYPLPVTSAKQQTQERNQPTVQIQINNYMDNSAQTSPWVEGNRPQKKEKKSPTQNELNEYFKQLKQTSRYLSDTAFRKYFNRQVFENYGRENTHGTNDGIIYGNYLKTHNINPHTGFNQPHDEETFYHALVTASPEKFLNINPKDIEDKKSRSKSQSRLRINNSIEKPLKKHQNDPQQIINDNIDQHQKLRQLSKHQLSPKNQSHKISNIKTSNQQLINKISPPKNIIRQQPQPLSPRIQSHYVNTKQTIQAIKPKQTNNRINAQLSPRNYVRSERQQISKLSQIKRSQNRTNENIYKKCPVDLIKENHMEHIMSKECNIQQPNYRQQRSRKGVMN